MKAVQSKYLILTLVLLGLAGYSSAFPNQMFWDDYDFVLNNQFVKTWDFGKFFSESLISGAGLIDDYWRPLLLTVFSLEWHLWGDSPAGYHVVSVLFHLANAVLLYFIVHRLFTQKKLAFFTAALFLLHPLQTEAVAYVAGLGDPLSVFFELLAIHFFLRFRQSANTGFASSQYYVSILCYALALTAKETAIILPALIGLLDFLLINPGLPFGKRLSRGLRALWPFILVGSTYLILRATVLNFQNSFNLYNEANIFTSNFSVRLLTFSRVFLTYLRLLVWPAGLHMERQMAFVSSFGSAPVIAGFALLLGSLLGTIFTARRLPVISLGLAWFLVSLFPVSNLLIPINGLIYEHWLYLPMIGLLLAIVWAAIELSRKIPASKILAVSGTAILVIFGGLTARRNQDWHNPITFYTKTLAFEPKSYRSLNNLGMAYADARRFESAEQFYKRAISLDPENPVAYHNLANLLRDSDRLEEAIANYQAALKQDSQFANSYHALLQTYLRANKLKEAKETVRTYFPQSYSQLEIYIFLSQISVEEKNFDDALLYLQKALELEPDNQTIQNAYLEVKRRPDKNPTLDP